MVRPALWALLVILPLTLGLRSVEHGERVTNEERLTADAASIMISDGWSARPKKHHLIGWLIAGARGDCRILVHFTPPEGASDDKFRILARSVGPVTFQYRGRMSRDLPRFVPMLAGHIQRYAWSFGLTIPTAPLIATARSPSCGTQAPDLTELRQHLQVPYKAN